MIENVIWGAVIAAVAYFTYHHVDRALKRRREAEETEARLTKNRYEDVLDKILHSPHLVPRTPELIEFVRSIEFVQVMGGHGRAHPYIYGKYGVQHRLWNKNLEDTAQELFERAAKQVSYWLHEMPDVIPEGTEMARKQLKDFL